MNLKKLNATKRLKESVENGVTLRETYAVGKSGPGGERGHLLFVREVADTPGLVFASAVACNDQTPGTVMPDWDVKDLTCTKCQKILDRIKSNLGKGT